MSVAFAEAAPRVSTQPEEYSRSLSTLRRLGRVTLTAEAGSEELLALARADFDTGLAEMLKTDPELRGSIEVNTVRTFSVVDGQTVAADGTPMVEVVRSGYDASRTSEDERLNSTQALRDYGDVLVAEAVDKLRPGEAMLVVSMDPKKELAGPDADFWKARGYRSGIAYAQWYCREDEGQLVGSAVSVDESDLTAWREEFEDLGIEIPTDVTPNTFIQHAYHFSANATEAQAIAEALRRRYYERVGRAPESDKLSVNDYLRSQKPLVDGAFDTYYPALAQALTTHRTPQVLQDLSLQVLQSEGMDQLDLSLRRQLLRAANGRQFDDDMGRALETVVRYATAEQLRAQLLCGLQDNSLHHRPFEIPPSLGEDTRYAYAYQQQAMQQLLVQSLGFGVRAQRVYGGCTGTSVTTADAMLSAEHLLRNPQDIFGGKAEKEDEHEDSDEYGPLEFECTEGHHNKRQRHKLLTECQHRGCKPGSVGCK